MFRHLSSLFTLALLVLTAEGAGCRSVVTKAIVLLSGNSSVTGTVLFSQPEGKGPVSITGTIRGLEASSSKGFHVHALGNLTDGCASLSTHFNPKNVTHGGLTDEVHHAGDLGNIQSDLAGVAVLKLSSSYMSLNGKLSIIGRGVVVHAGTDDLGKGGDEGSRTTGNAGGRSACGIIGIAETT